jgi:acetyltransferase-like isoleucine patch superfamily enzyme
MKILTTYGIMGSIRLFRDVLLTVLDSIFCFKNRLRILRRPLYIRGKKYIRIGKGFTSGVALRLDAFSIDKTVCLEIGENVEVNDYVHIGAVKSVKLGNNVLIASKVYISDHNHGYYGLLNRHDNPLTIPRDRDLSYSSVLIEDNVWIGEFVAILPGVTIGKGSIIGAMSVVTRDIPPFCIAVGSPAKVVKKYNFETAEWERIGNI